MSEPDEIHHQSTVAMRQLTASVETSKFVVTKHFMASALHHDQQRIFN